ncbi:MAG: hypothetical protein IPH86_01785 [bacterium]|nr:hypothetical protein [bacterium]
MSSNALSVIARPRLLLATPAVDYGVIIHNSELSRLADISLWSVRVRVAGAPTGR